MAAGLPDDVARFIDEHVHSVEQLEVLLALRAEPEREWTADELSAVVATSPASVSLRLADLGDRGFVARGSVPDSFRYAAPAHTARVIDALADCYGRLRVRVISRIFSKPSEGARSFADAFRLRDDRDDR